MAFVARAAGVLKQQAGINSVGLRLARAYAAEPAAAAADAGYVSQVRGSRVLACRELAAGTARVAPESRVSEAGHRGGGARSRPRAARR